MPQTRLQWHLVKCKAKLERQKLNLPDYHCKYNYLHIFFSETELKEHQDTCQLKANKIDRNVDEAPIEVVQPPLATVMEIQMQSQESTIETKLFREYRNEVKQLWEKQKDESNDLEVIKSWDEDTSETGPEKIEEEESSQSKDDESPQEEINEEEIGKRNYERFLKLNDGDQKRAR